MREKPSEDISISNGNIKKLYLIEITPRELYRAIQCIKSKEQGTDKISIKMLFPTKLEVCSCTSVPKITLPKTAVDYRPISILPALSKALEYPVHQVLKYIIQNNSSIHFSPSHSTCAALHSVTYDLRLSMDDRKLSLACLKDLIPIFIKGLPKCLKYCIYHMYADDVQLCAVNSLSNVREIFNNGNCRLESGFKMRFTKCLLVGFSCLFATAKASPMPDIWLEDVKKLSDNHGRTTELGRACLQCMQKSLLHNSFHMASLKVSTSVLVNTLIMPIVILCIMVDQSFQLEDYSECKMPVHD
ncbi:hypothetical protein PR048_022697 [Dryococelus australis]|uniref:Reverse transcriptase domain-containing protein n=1 Tax=Dryococelus australis TaxID=614101 RepID=A0ABQ9GS04_9NEOP|nr:hypothetical protein PR048_022697 [Dryococelus australis]